MNTRKIALLAALPAATLMANNALAGVDVYGKINVSLQNLSEETNGVSTKDQWELLSNASRFGIKASTDLGDSGLKAIAKLEYEVFADDGDDGSGNKSEFSQRNIYGGLQGGFGTLIAGNFDTPVKVSQGKVDLFNDLEYADIKNIIQGEDRVKNIIMYTTPKMDSGIALNVAVMPGEGADLDGDGTADDGVADALSASVTWTNKMFYAALAMNQAVDSRDLIRLTGQANMGDFTLGGIIQQAEFSDDTSGKSDEDGYILSAAYKMGKTTLKAQYSVADEDVGAVDEEERESFSLGVDYMMDKKTKVYAYWTDWSEDQGSDEDTKETVALGLSYGF